jgi:hypothetical protein
MPPPDSDLVVSTDSKKELILATAKKYSSSIVIVILLIIVAAVAYAKCNGFISADSIITRKNNNQVRSDTIDKDFNLKELEKSVALLNKKSGAYG